MFIFGLYMITILHLKKLRHFECLQPHVPMLACYLINGIAYRLTRKKMLLWKWLFKITTTKVFFSLFVLPSVFFTLIEWLGHLIGYQFCNRLIG